MKLTSILLLGICLQVSAKSLSQTITFSGKDVSLQSVFSAIKKQTGYTVLYNYDQLKQSKPVIIHVTKIPLEDFLQQVLKDQPFEYSIENTTIFISLKSADRPRKPSETSAVVTDPPLEVKGRITDTDGNPLTGATITVRRTRSSQGQYSGQPANTTTDAAGQFSINANPGDIIVISFVGYESREILLNSQNINSTIEVKLSVLVSELDKAVVSTGYWKTDKKLSTGNIVKITSKEIEKQPVSNPIQSLQGLVQGLFVTQQTGMPGSNYQIQIRGLNSIASGNQPLYVVDGIPFPGTSISNTSVINAAASPFVNIDPSNIESIEILKDADATAIYGSRGANGVILITTKKGKAGKPKLDFTITTGFGRATRLPDMMTTQPYLQMRRQAFANDGITPTVSTAPDLLVWDTTQYFNWPDLLFGETSRLTDMNLSFSGGDEKVKFLIEGGLYDEGMIIPGGFGLNRKQFRSGIDYTSSDKRFTLSASAGYSSLSNKVPREDVTRFFFLPPVLPAYNSAGGLFWANFTNPFGTLGQISKIKINTLTANLALKFKIYKDISLKINAGFLTMDKEQVAPFSKNMMNPATNPSSNTFFLNASLRSYIIEPQLTYERRGAKGNFQALAGATYQYNKSKDNFFFASNFSSEHLLENIQAASLLFILSNNLTEYKYGSVYGRLSYDWDKKYIINATIRRDGSSRFGPGKKFGNFGAVGLAWNFSEENFIQNAFNFLSSGKLRASYGITGNDQIADYQYLSTYGSSNNYQSAGIIPNRIGNSEYGWEINRKFEAAVELGFLKNRLQFNTSFFINRSDNQLVGNPLPTQTGFSSYQANLNALVQNRGWEFDLSAILIQKEKLTWSSSFNISFIKNKLLAFPGLSRSSYANTYVIGQPITVIKGYHFTGIDPTTGLPQFEDVDRDGRISFPNDYVPVGKNNPDYYGGFNNSLAYKNWQLDVLLYFVKQTATTIQAAYTGTSTAPGRMINYYTAMQPWSPSHTIANYPKLSATAGTPANNSYTNFLTSSAVWDDGSFIRVRNINLSYSLGKLLQRLKVSNCQVYLQGQNLITITKYVGWDPENHTHTALPPLKIISAGIRLSF